MPGSDSGATCSSTIPRSIFVLAQDGIWENQNRLTAAPRIYVWTATGNTDQLFVAFLLELMERLGSDPSRVELVEFFHARPAGRKIQQMGELDAGQMRMHPAPRQLSMDEWMAYRQRLAHAHLGRAGTSRLLRRR